MQAPVGPLWDVFTFIVAGVAVPLAVAVVLYRAGRKKRSITYEVVSNAPVDRNQWRVVLKVQNSGNEAIRRDEFDEPIQFHFDAAMIWNEEILNTQPPGLPAEIGGGDDWAVTLKPLLLNRGDTVTISVNLIGFDGQVHPPTGRVQGVERIRERKRHPVYRSIAMRLGLATMFRAVSIVGIPALGLIADVHIFHASSRAIVQDVIVGLGLMGFALAWGYWYLQYAPNIVVRPAKVAGFTVSTRVLKVLIFMVLYSVSSVAFLLLLEWALILPLLSALHMSH